jgi:polar amino acid transport system substrate-binding protein
MRSIRFRSVLQLAALTAIVSVVLFAMGCGSSGPSSSESPSVSATSIDLASIAQDPSINALLPARIRSGGVLRVAMGFPYAPWEYYDPATSKNPAGFDYDLSQAIGAKLGVKALSINSPFDSIILSLKGGQNDMIMSDMYDNLDREQQGISFVDYAYDGTSILVKKGNPEGISNLDSLAGKTVTVLRGSTQQLLLEKLNQTFKSSGKQQMKILSLPGSPEGLLAVSGGKSVAQVTDHSQAAYIAQTTSAGNTFEVLTDPAAPHGYDPAIVGIGILTTNQQLVTAVQKALQALIDEGSYQKIIAKYGLLPVDSAMVNQGGQSASPSPTP